MPSCACWAWDASSQPISACGVSCAGRRSRNSMVKATLSEGAGPSEMAPESSPATAVGARPGRASYFLRGTLALVFLLGFGIRLYGLKNPPLDFNAVVQLRSALIARGI